VVALVLAALALAAPPKPHIVWKPIPFGPTRLAETAAYAKRHYGIDSYVLHPRAIVEHVTVTTSFSSAYNTFANDVPDAELHELPGTCAHFIVDRDGTIYQLVRLNVICRHTVGLNWAAIGIEHVGLSDAQVLGDVAQMRSSLALTVWLMWRYRIPLADVIGHNESLSSPLHKELYAPWRCQTHGDWKRADMNVYRTRLVALAHGYGLGVGPPPQPRPTGC
jgi:beta-N-acetylhexosaminidase